MQSVVVIGKVNADMEFVSVGKIKGSFVRTLKQIGDENANCTIVIEWSTWFLLSPATQRRYNFVVFSKKQDWTQDVWVSIIGDELFKSRLFGSNDIVIAGSGKLIRKVITSIGPHHKPSKIIAIPIKTKRVGKYAIPPGYYNQCDDTDVQVFLW